jgi:hypothetical protein
MTAKKLRTTVHITVSVSAELRQRMRSCREPVNWSAIASQAFEAELARKNLQSGESNIQDVIHRLRGTQREIGGEAFQRGAAMGTSWAERQATVPELQCLYAEYRKRKSEHGGCFENWLTNDSSLSAADVFVKIIRPHADENAGSGHECLGHGFPNGRESMVQSDEFVHGFAAGAINIWKHVKDSL